MPEKEHIINNLSGIIDENGERYRIDIAQAHLRYEEGPFLRWAWLDVIPEPDGIFFRLTTDTPRNEVEQARADAYADAARLLRAEFTPLIIPDWRNTERQLLKASDYYRQQAIDTE